MISSSELIDRPGTVSSKTISDKGLVLITFFYSFNAKLSKPFIWLGLTTPIDVRPINGITVPFSIIRIFCLPI